MSTPIDIINPRTGQADYSIVPLLPGELTTLALRMRSAQPRWAERPIEERAAILKRLGLAIGHHREPLVTALCADTGRIGISRTEVDSIPAMLTRWADRAPALITQHSVNDFQTSHPSIKTDLRLVPYPLVGVISPWNFPLILALIDAIPALMAGCAVLVKPSEVTPRFIRPLVAALTEVPELQDILAIVEGDGATGEALVSLVDYVAFTGSVATGRKVAEAAARAFIPASLELGGKDPFIVLASADPQVAARTALRASVVNTGQACQSIERIYVAQEIAEPFITALVREASAVQLNYPDLDQGDIGPFIFSRQAEIVQAQIDQAVAAGAKVLTGGKVETLGGGKYLRPTVLTGVTPDMDVMVQESFGPILPVAVFGTVDEAVTLANASEFGLSGAVFAGSLEEAEAVGCQLNVGGVSLNDGSLTAIVWETEKSSFGSSGMGPSRMGDSGLLRFFRRQAIMRQHGTPLPLAAYGEGQRT